MPDNTVLYVDGRAYDIQPGDTISAMAFDATEGLVGLRHENGANVVFVDGHARQVIQDIKTTGTARAWFLEATGRQQLVWKLQ